MNITSKTKRALEAGLANRQAATELQTILDRGAGVYTVDFTIGAEAADAIAITIQCNDANGSAIAERRALTGLLFDDTSGTFNTDNFTVAATTGAVEELVADKVLKIVTDATGKAVITLTIAGEATTYLGIETGSGEYTLSDAITHAA